jgi:hypothetical protein
MPLSRVCDLRHVPWIVRPSVQGQLRAASGEHSLDLVCGGPQDMLGPKAQPLPVPIAQQLVKGRQGSLLEDVVIAGHQLACALTAMTTHKVHNT